MPGTVMCNTLEEEAKLSISVIYKTFVEGMTCMLQLCVRP